jgi:radical SAM superfamily enzyme YgiQ (UPF0313 family)
MNADRLSVKAIREFRKILIVVPPLVNREDDVDPDPTRPDFETRRLVSPVEPIVVAADLLSRGYEAELFDLGVHVERRYEKLEARLRQFAPDAVVMVQAILTFATAQDWNGRQVFELARRIDPGAVTVLTGNTATNYPGKAIRDGVCDYSIRGEVDFAVGELLDALRSGADVTHLDGIAATSADGTEIASATYPRVDVADLPLPAYRILDDEHRAKYAETLEIGKIRYPERSPNYRDIMLSRSCVLRCSFCSVAHLRGPRQPHRRKPLDLVVGEIEQALDEGIEEIHFFDDLFAENEGQILEFTEVLARRNLRFPWFVGQGLPLWPVTRDAMTAMAETGMYRVIAPLESGSDRALRECAGKIHSTVAHHHDVVGWAHRAGLEIVGMFVVGMPGETRAEILDTVLFAENHPEIDYSVFSIATPMVGTRLMKKITKQNLLEDQEKINRVIKRTVALYRTDAFSEYEMGVIRAYDWSRINFSTPARKAKYARMVGLSLEQLEQMIAHSKETFRRFFPDYDGPLSFKELYDRPGLFAELSPKIPEALY